MEREELTSCFFTEGYPAKDAQAELGATHQIIITESDVQHQYFQVATGLLKDIISESAKVKDRCPVVLF